VKLLITGGGSRYIGSVVAAQRVDAGHEVVVFDNLSTESRQALPRVRGGFGATYSTPTH
jgi:UDP-glucose 4-epimerase